MGPEGYEVSRSRKEQKRRLPRGVFERRPGEYWIRYADRQGNIRREKIGPFLKQAVRGYQKRKCQLLEGKFFPEKLNERILMFSEVAQDFLKHSKQTKRSHGHDEGRMQTLLRLWRHCPLAELCPGRIERDLAECASGCPQRTTGTVRSLPESSRWQFGTARQQRIQYAARNTAWRTTLESDISAMMRKNAC
jgi:hypothetical protein